MDTVVFDIETKESFDEVGGRDPSKLSVSLVGAYSYTRDQFQTFLESELPIFWQWLLEAELLIGFNSDHFDIPILSRYWSNLLKIQSLDLMSEIKKSAGHRVKLDSIAAATLGENKTADGLEAIKMFREGRVEDLRRYCLDDVRITRDIYEFGKEEGKVLITNLFNSNQIKEISVNFKPEIKKIQSPPDLSFGF